MKYMTTKTDATKTNEKWLMSLVIRPQIVEVNWHSKITMINRYTVSIIAHYHTSNMAAIFSDYTIWEPQTLSFSGPDKVTNTPSSTHEYNDYYSWFVSLEARIYSLWALTSRAIDPGCESQPYQANDLQNRYLSPLSLGAGVVAGLLL